MGMNLRRCVLASVLLFSPFFFMSTLSAENKKTMSVGEETSVEFERLHKQALGLFKGGKLQEAVAVWEKAAKLGDNTGSMSAAYVEVLSNLGLAYYKMGSQYFPLAERNLNRVIDLNPNKWNSYLTLGDLCYESLALDCALGNYDLFLKLNPNYKNADVIKKRIDGLIQRKSIPSDDEAVAAQFQNKYVHRLSVMDDLPAYNFYVTINKDSFLSRIDILRDGETEISQTLKYGEDDLECEPPSGDSTLLEMRDFNDDGFGDLKVICTGGGGARVGYLYYLYYKRAAMFIPFSGGALPGSAKVNGSLEIRTYKYLGKGGQQYDESFFKSQNGNLILMKEVKQEESEYKNGKKYYKKVTSERREDKMVPVNELLVESKEE